MYKAACYALFRGESNKLLFVLRENTNFMPHHYGLPSGRVEPDENFLGATTREVYEEVGIKILPSQLRHVHTMHRRADDGRLWVDIFFEVEHWTGEPINAEPHKHSEIKWLDLKNLPNNVVPNHKHALEKIYENITYSEFGW